MSSQKSHALDLVAVDELGLTIDFSALSVPLAEHEVRARKALSDMAALERGAIANPDENRRVGHYWLRAPERAPDAALSDAIRTTLSRVKAFAAKIHAGREFDRVLVCGIGGSALGPQLAHDALGGPGDALATEFLDNTDPQGFARTFDRLGDGLARTLVVVVSKSGGTPETRNGLEEVRARLAAMGRDPASNLVAVTGTGSALERRAQDEGWIDIFPMWDWVGGRTSQTSAVGLLPMALAGHDIDAFLAGARAMDEATRDDGIETNPALRLALAWYHATGGAGRKDMVVLPYRDRLSLFARYLQQLVMESIGKEKDLAGNIVHQGIAVYGNKGSTDQHAFVQQLREGLDNFFVTFIVALDDDDPRPLEVEPAITSGDYLLGFFLGTRRALIDAGRQALTITVPKVDARALGALIALYERAVGFYASFVGINAYHQPGVEAGKKAAARVLELQKALVAALAASPDDVRDAAGWAAAVGHADLAAEAHWVLAHLAANRRGVRSVEGGRYGVEKWRA